MDIMQATLTDLRNPAALLKAANSGETVILTHHGRPAYELRALPAPVDWDAMERNRADWPTEAEAKEIEAALERTAKVLTHDTVP
jgi:antitoxin (DNA-binding transcriptional repressor) of toxin-antitoxin stability system